MRLDITEDFIAANSHSERKIDRFSVSDVWAILNGYLKPENYFKTEKLPLDKVLMMWNGTIKHYGLNYTLKRLGYEPEVKTEYHPDGNKVGWVLVGKADGVGKNEILELKTSDEVMDRAKIWHETQVKLYCSLFNKPGGVIYQPIIAEHKVYFKELGRVKQDKKWFEKVLEELNIFHQKLCKLNKN